MTSAAVQAPTAQIGSMTSHSEYEICKPRAIMNSPLATTVAILDHSCGYLSIGKCQQAARSTRLEERRQSQEVSRNYRGQLRQPCSGSSRPEIMRPCKPIPSNSLPP